MKNSTDQKLDDFEQRELIASGSFSWIYRCVNRKDGSVSAIKIAKSLELFRRGFWQEDDRRKTLRASAGKRPAPLYRTEAFGWGSEWLETFPLNEALTPSELLRRQAAKLSACNDSSLVKFIEAGVAEDQGYLRMEYLPGPTLRELLRHGKASVQTLIEVLEGLRRLHHNAHFGYHGDLKPENIIVTATGAKMIDPGDFPGNDGQVSSVYSSPNRVCVTTSAYYPLLQPNDSVACGAMLWEIVLGCQPFTAWEEPNPEIGPRLAKFEGFRLHPIFHRPYRGGQELQSIRRPASLIPGISEELETFLLRAIGMELDADGWLETLKGDDSVLFLERGTVRSVKGLKEGMSWYSTLYEGLIRYHDELEDLRSATRISVRPTPPQVVTTPAILLSIEEMSSLPPLPRLIKKLHLSPGDTFGGYLLQRYVANGAFCCVYEAINVEDGSISAIKIGKSTEEIEIDGQPTTLEGAPKEHHTEAEMMITGGTCRVTLSSADVLAKQAAHLSSWNDPGVVRLQEGVIREDTSYLCLEHLPGLTLRQLIRAKQASLQTLVEILGTLDRVVARSPIKYHGDLKPENIIVTTTGAKMIDPGYFGELKGKGDIMVTTKAYYPRLQPDDLFACGLMLWEIVLHYHPLLDYWAGFDAKTIGPELSETISHTFLVVERAYLERLATVTKPSWLNREITPTIEDLLLKAIGLRRLADGRIDLGERFKGFRELKDALIEQMTII